MRITADCPLIDPEITDKTIAAFLKGRLDYACNTLTRSYPRGLDTEVISIDALARAWKDARERHEREHVTPYIYEHPAMFRILPVTGDADYSKHRWTVDTGGPGIVRAIYDRLQDHADFLGDVLALS